MQKRIHSFYQSLILSFSPLWTIVLLIHAGYFGYQIAHQRLEVADSSEFLILADNIQQHGTYYCGDLNQPIRTDYYSKRSPLYPFLIIALKSLWDSDFVVILFQNLISLFNIWLLLQILSLKGFPSEKRWWLLPFLLFYPAQLIYANLLMTELLLQGFILGMVWSLVKFDSEKKGKYLWIYHGLLCLAILTKPVMYVYAVPSLATIGFLFWKSHRFRWGHGLSVILPFLVVLGVGKWNQQRMGTFHYSSIQIINLLQYNTYYSLLSDEGTAYADSVVDGIAYQADEMADYAARESFIQTQCLHHLSAHKWAYFKLHLKGIGNFFIDPGRFDLYTFLGREKREGKGRGLLYYYSKEGYTGIFSYLKLQPLGLVFLLVLIAIFNLIKFLGMLYFGLHRRISLIDKVILLAPILYLAVLTGPLGASRFALPVFPLLVIVALLGMEKWRENK